MGFVLALGWGRIIYQKKTTKDTKLKAHLLTSSFPIFRGDISHVEE